MILALESGLNVMVAAETWGLPHLSDAVWSPVVVVVVVVVVVEVLCVCF